MGTGAEEPIDAKLWEHVLAGRRSFLSDALVSSAGVACASISRAGMALVAEPRASSSWLPQAHLPARTIDCHCHIFDPARFPYVASRSYTPGAATLDDLKIFHARLGIGRVVLVQPSVYGTDNRCLVGALRKLGPTAARGIAVIDPAATAVELRALREVGVVGVRVNLNVTGERRTAAAIRAVTQAVDRVAPLGWVVQIYVDLPLVEALADTIAASPVPILLDHYAGAQAALGLEQPGLSTLQGLLACGKVWVKLSAPYHASSDAPSYRGLAPIARALIEASADRLVWGSDWPHTGGGAGRSGRQPGEIEPFRLVDDERMLSVLESWFDSADAMRQVLVDNASKLFCF